MRIKDIHITNFRGIAKKQYYMHPELTVVVGNNTSGKTTLLQAVQVALGGFLKCLKGLPADKAYSHNIATSEVLKVYNPHLKEFVANDGETAIEANAVIPILPDKLVYWKRTLKGNTTSQNQKESPLLYEYAKTIQNSRNVGDPKDALPYPLILSFGVNRIDNQYRAATKTIARETSVAKGYKSALRETVDFKSAFNWLYKFDASLKHGLVFPNNKQAFLTAIERAIPALSDIHIDVRNNEFSALVSVAGQEPAFVTYDQMSDGFKSVICLVAEIAYRCISLNGYLDADAIVKTPGVVMIDEVDLYLHPHWQKHFLADLRAAFPAIQFIVTSHSPFIIQSVKRENLIVLDGVADDTDPIYRSIEEIALREMNIETPHYNPIPRNPGQTDDV